eukprot:SAG25_NODE_12757_length_275_cov_1.153409_1_plen_54_part_01
MPLGIEWIYSRQVTVCSKPVPTGHQAFLLGASDQRWQQAPCCERVRTDAPIPIL